MFLGLACAELACRLALDLNWSAGSQIRASKTFGLIYEGRPYARFEYTEGRWDGHNRWGMRGPDFTLARAAGERRLAILGDSIAHGARVSYEEIAPRLIEKRVNERLPRGKLLRVVNFGTTSYNVWDYYFTLQGKAWRFEPDGVLLFLCMNDAAPKALALPLLAPGVPLPLHFRLKHLLLKSRLVYFLIYQADLRGKLGRLWSRQGSASPPAGPVASASDFVATLDPESVAAVKRNEKLEGWSLESMRHAFEEMFREENWARALQVIEAIHESARQRGAFFKVVIFPVALQVPPGYRDERPQRLLRRHLAAKGIEFVDLLEPFRRSTGRGKRIFVARDLLHPNAVGHRIAADEIMRVLAKEYGF